MILDTGDQVGLTIDDGSYIILFYRSGLPMDGSKVFRGGNKTRLQVSSGPVLRETLSIFLFIFFFFLGLHTESEGQTAGEAPEIISDDQRKGEQAIYTVLPRVGTVADHSQLRRKPLTGQNKNN